MNGIPSLVREDGVPFTYVTPLSHSEDTIMAQRSIPDLEAYVASIGWRRTEDPNWYSHPATGGYAARRTLLRQAQEYYEASENEAGPKEEKGHVTPPPTESTARALARFKDELVAEGFNDMDRVSAILAGAAHGLISHEGLVLKREKVSHSE